MRIGIDVRELEIGRLTGTGRLLINLLEFAAENKKNWKFVLFANQHTKIDLGGINLKQVFITEYFTLYWDQVKLPLYLKREKIDVFLAPILKLPFFAPCKSAVIISDLTHFFFDGYRASRIFPKRLYYRVLSKVVAEKADKIITISQYSKKNISKAFRMPKEKINVVYPGIDRNYRPMAPVREKTLSKYGINKKFIFYLGNFKPHKNVKGLIEAYRGLPEEVRAKYMLVLGGARDKFRAALEKTVHNLRMEKNIIFTGFIAEKDLPSIYSAAEAFVFPSLHEGFGLPPLEAMACGTPVVAFRTSSLPEVVGEAGILVNPLNRGELTKKLAEITEKKSLRDELAYRGLDRAKNFSAARMASEILDILENAAL